MINRHYYFTETVDRRDAICKLLSTLKSFGILNRKTRMYVNWSGDAPFVDVIYER